MAYEALTAVQDVADNQVEVASKVNSLIDTYHISSDDVQSVEIEPFGTNKFLIVISYLYRYLDTVTALLGLETPSLDSTKSYKRKVTSKILGLLIKAPTTLLTYHRIVESQIGLIVSDLILSITKITITTLGLISSDVLLNITKTPINKTVGLLSGDITKGIVYANRDAPDLNVGLNMSMFEARYNGIPIEE